MAGARRPMGELELALSFDDVLLVPKRSAVRSRREVCTSSRFTRSIELAAPLVSANMDTITESQMAIAMAQAGGIGVIHRFCEIERQAAEVARVKRFLTYVIDDPYAIEPDRTIAEARAETLRRGVTGLLVTTAGQELLGILTARDLRAEPDERPVREAMTPRERLVSAPPGVSLDEARALMHRHRVEKLPLVEEGRLAGLITLRDIELRERFPDASRDERGRLRVAGAVGVRGDYLARAEALLDAGADALVLDVAHGHAEYAIDAVRTLKARFPGAELVAGNVATAEGVRDLGQAGADAVKVGIGPGFVCTTRLIAGTGVPQFSCVLDCARAGRELGLPVISDGGIRRPADLVKALAAGADAVMVGSLFAGTSETPGEVVERDGRRYKVYRGMASRSAAAERPERRAEALDQYVPEGVEVVVPLRESVHEIVTQLVGGLRSGMSYIGARSLPELRANAEFVRITPAGQAESAPGVATVY
jgi:IMP dehydrogenase